jgi:hypothetical protein
MFGFGKLSARTTIFASVSFVFAVAIMVAGAEPVSPVSPQPIKPVPVKILPHPFPFPILLRGGEVHGSIYLALDQFLAAEPGAQIFLPDISVYLENVTTSATSTSVTTNLDGLFAIPAQPRATYRLCWKAPGFVAGCAPQTIALGANNTYLKPVGIAASPGIVIGRVALKDGSACRFLLPFFDKNTFTTVTAAPASGPSETVRANSSGYYALPALPTGPASLTAKCEAATTTAGTTVTGGVALANMTLPNARPTMVVAYAEQGGKVVRAVADGSSVQGVVQVTPGGPYPMHYSWAVDPSTPGFVSTDSPNVSWTVPGGPGQSSIYLLAHDDHGGNLFWTIPLSTMPNHIVFSGRVIANSTNPATAVFTVPVANATVALNGVITHTNAQGAFSLALTAEAARYVLTITKPGYQMLSRALYAPVENGIFRLYPAHVFSADPTKTISLSEPADDTLGSQVEIAPNTLASGLTGSGAHVTTPLHVQLASYNLNDAQNQIPGDYGGIDKSGQGVALTSYGALDVAITDAGGHPVNLAPGTQATVRVAIAPALLASAPATIPVWHYDTAKGMWTEDGVATKVGAYYETKVTHFSAVNMDLAFSNAACTRIVVDTSIMPVPFRLQMTTVSGGPAQLANHQNQTVSDALNVVVREPPGLKVRFDIVDSNGNVLTNASQTITVGAASPSGSEWNPPPNPPYSDCTTQITYNEQTLSGIFPPGPNGFLAYLTPSAYLSPSTADPLTEAYYHAIDPVGTKTAAGDTTDFTNWKNLNGFSRTGVTRVAYQNIYDLGFGRDMYMQTGGQTGSCAACIAFYVSNYKAVSGGLDEADAAAQQTSSQLIATVAMEYGPLNGTGATFTRFYVFGANGAISNAAALDDFGPKNVPALCVICHNGNIASNATTSDIASSGGNLQIARFIPFDIQSYAMPLTSGSQFTLASQTPNFNTMNTAILKQTNPSAALTDLITTWYGHEGNTTAANTTYNGNAVPSGWSSNPTLYSDVVKTSCRSCHTTRDSGTPDISWDTFSSLDDDATFAKILACGSPTFSHPMPQAERTFARFWLSTNPSAPITLGSAGLTGWGTPTCP